MEVLLFYNKDNVIYDPSIIINTLYEINDHKASTYNVYLIKAEIILILNLVFKLNLTYK